MLLPLNRVHGVAVMAVCALLAPLSACNKTTTAPASVESASAATTLGTDVDDTVVTTRVRSALLANEDTKSFDIKVETRKGDVQLSGFVDNQEQMDRGVAIANGIEGVKHVSNMLSLKEGKQTVGNKIDDSFITAAVKSALMADSIVKSYDVNVVTRKGEVQLSGFLDNETQVQRAVDIAQKIEGVTKVENHFNLKK